METEPQDFEITFQTYKRQETTNMPAGNHPVLPGEFYGKGSKAK
jgi:hypothetical protein